MLSLDRYTEIAEAVRLQVQPIALQALDEPERYETSQDVLTAFSAALSGIVTAAGHGCAVMTRMADRASVDKFRAGLAAQLEAAFEQSLNRQTN